MLDIKAIQGSGRSEGEPELSFEEWSALKMKKGQPCKVISELRCKPFKDDNFCINCYRMEMEPYRQV